MPATWECPGCKRRVPLAIEECRCGWQKSQVAIARPLASDRARGTTQRSWELWVGLAVAALALAWGIYWTVSPPVRPPAEGILGYVDPTPPPPPTTVRPK